MLGSRGMVVLGALVLAGLAFFVLMRGDRNGEDLNSAALPRGVQQVKPSGSVSRELPPRNAPALDDIDAESRAKMRELLREAGEE